MLYRDDIVFFIFLYQRYIYKEDKSRVNEFGFSGDMLDEMEEKKEGGQGEAVENTEDTPALTDASTEDAAANGNAAWKNSQKQKNKKAKKND